MFPSINVFRPLSVIVNTTELNSTVFIVISGNLLMLMAVVYTNIPYAHIDQIST